MHLVITYKHNLSVGLRLIVLLAVLAQVEIAEREQELIKGIELIRQKMVKSTHEASQKIIELNTELAELEVSWSQFLLVGRALVGVCEKLEEVFCERFQILN